MIGIRNIIISALNDTKVIYCIAKYGYKFNYQKLIDEITLSGFSRVLVSKYFKAHTIGQDCKPTESVLKIKDYKNYIYEAEDILKSKLDKAKKEALKKREQNSIVNRLRKENSELKDELKKLRTNEL